jgi:tetratricopeptide (TPR) repeat protein
VTVVASRPMRAGLPRDAGELAGWGFLIAGAALSALALFAGGGSTYGPLVGVGGAAVLVAAVAVALALFGVIPWPALDRQGLACLVLLAALVVWIGLSVLWSVVPDRSWEYFNRGVVYLAFALLGVFIAATVTNALRLVSAGLTVLLSAVIAWALAGKVVPALFPDGERIARLRDPIDYWNGLALVAAMALPLGLSFAVRREYPRAVRTAVVVLLFGAAVALLLTYSRGGVVVALLVIGAYVAVSRLRVEAVAALLIALPPAIAVSAWAFTQPGISSDLQPASVRETDGLQFGLALLVVGSAVAGAAYYVLGQEERWRPRFRWSLSGAWLAAGAAVALLVAVLAVSRGDPVDWARDGFREFTNPVSQAGTNPERLREFNLNSRWTWWEEAWTLFTDDPVGGTGAGSFAVARRPIRINTTFATEPHNLALQFLAETGLVGFLLFAGLVGTAVVSVVRAVRRATGLDAAAAAALALALFAYLLQAQIDNDWDFLALTAPVMVVLGVLLATGRPAGATRRAPLWAIGAILVAVASLYSLAAPWLATRAVDDAFAAIDRDDPPAALDAARRARTLNPLAIEPLLVTAAAEEARGDGRSALVRYVQAVELQPLNWRTWYELGRFELRTGREERAIRHLQRARELDPLGPANDELIALGH